MHHLVQHYLERHIQVYSTISHSLILLLIHITQSIAVAVNNDTVFILWGIDGNRIGVNSILILDVSNPDAITLSENFVDANLPTQELPSAGLNKGAKIGIAVGCAVAVSYVSIGVFTFSLT